MTFSDRALARLMLALCVWREARGEKTLRGKRLVAVVIRNRVEDPKRWPNTYSGVITQPKQFSAFNAGDPNATLFPIEGDPAWTDSLNAADAVLGADATELPANHYHAKSVTPPWARPDKIVATEGNHVFYAL